MTGIQRKNQIKNIMAKEKILQDKSEIPANTGDQIKTVFTLLVMNRESFHSRKKGSQFKGIVLALKDTFPEVFKEQETAELYEALLRPANIQRQLGGPEPRVRRGGRSVAPSGRAATSKPVEGCDGCGEDAAGVYGEELAELEETLKEQYKGNPAALREAAESEFGVQVPEKIKQVNKMVMYVIGEIHRRS